MRGQSIAAPRAPQACTRTADCHAAWIVAAARAELLRAIRDSAADGLDPQDYHLAGARAASQTETAQPGASEEAWLDYDLLQSDALARARSTTSLFGKVDPRRGESAVELPPRDPSRPARRSSCSSCDRRAVAVRRGRAPRRRRYAMYRNLRAELARYRELRRGRGGTRSRAGPTLKLQCRDPPGRGAALPGSRLTGELAAPAQRERRRQLIFDDSVVAAVARVPVTANGLEPDVLDRRSDASRAGLSRSTRASGQIGGVTSSAAAGCSRPRPDLRRRQRRRLSRVLPARQRARLVRARAGRQAVPADADLPLDHQYLVLNPTLDRSAGNLRERHPPAASVTRATWRSAAIGVVDVARAVARHRADRLGDDDAAALPVHASARSLVRQRLGRVSSCSRTPTRCICTTRPARRSSRRA